MSAGRPLTDNALLEARGSKHVRPNVAQEALREPLIPPVILSEDAQRQWNQFVPRLAENGIVCESDRMMLCVMCKALAAYFTDVVADAKEYRLAAETLLDIAKEFGLTPLSRQKTIAPTQAPQVDARTR